MLGGLDHPDEYHFAGSDGTSGVARYKVPDVWNLVCDADAAGEHHYRTVRMEDVMPAIRSLDIGG